MVCHHRIIATFGAGGQADPIYHGHGFDRRDDHRLLIGVDACLRQPAIAPDCLSLYRAGARHPIVVQVMFIYFALPVLIGVRVDPLAAAIASIVVNSGAYIAEIVRGSFQSVAKGLHEAGLALGMPEWQVLTSVVGPVAFRRMIPPLGNQFIVSLKAT